MRYHWIKSLFRTWGLRKDSSRQEAFRRLKKPLFFDILEQRDVPATVMFQQGAPIMLDGVPGANYTGAIEVLTNSTTPNASENGGVLTTAAYIDSMAAGSLGSPNQQDMLKFGNLFQGETGGVIPVGSTINFASIRYITATADEAGSAASPGPFGTSQLLIPFTTTTTWGTLGLSPGNNEIGRAGMVLGVQSTRPISSLRNADGGPLLNDPNFPNWPGVTLGTPSFFDLNISPGTTASHGIETFIDITSAVQDWANSPTRNFGVVTRSEGTGDGWAARSINHSQVAERPLLTINFTPPPVTAVRVANFQQGVDGYNSTSSVWLQGEGAVTVNTTTNGSDMNLPVYLDGYTQSGGNSGDDQMLIRFDKMFGNGPGQIPVGATILSAAFEVSTAGVANLGNAQANGYYGASQVLVDWDTSTHYQDVTPWGGDGPAFPGSKTNTLPNIGATSSELKLLSMVGPIVVDQIARFDVTSAVQDWAANPTTNKGLNIQAAGTDDGWGVHFPGSLFVSLRPKLVVRYTQAASTEPANNTLDLTGGALTYVGANALANNLTVELSAGTYTITDTSGNITLSGDAVSKGWTAVGNVATGPASSITSGIGVATGTGVDTITIKGLDNQLSIDAGSTANDSVVIDGVLNTGGKSFSIIGTTNITTPTAASLIDVGATNVITMTASNGIGSSSFPIRTKAFGVGINAGNGGAFITESDGAFIGGNVTGTGTITVVNLAGSLGVGNSDTLRTEAGAITLSSADGVSIDGSLGVSALTGAGLITINANTDGAGTQGFEGTYQGTITSTGNVTINVNTGGGGTGNAFLGVTNIGGTLTIAANGGSILWGNDFITGIELTDFSILASSAAKNYVFSTTGANSSIGTLARPIQASPISVNDAVNDSNLTFTSGSGGIYFTTWGPVDSTITSATTTGSGPIRIATANFGTATTSTTNTHNLFVTGTVASLPAGPITLISNDNLSLQATAIIGGAGYGGTITLQANSDQFFEQRLLFVAGATVSTTDSSANAVNLICSGTDRLSDATAPGFTLGNVTIGDGGTITVNNTTGVNTGTSLLNSGNITQLSGTRLNAGVNGKIVMTARSRLNGAATIPASGFVGGTSGANAFNVTTGILDITGTNLPINIAGDKTMTITANSLARNSATNTEHATLTANTLTITTTGQLIVGGASQTDNATMTLTSTATTAGNGVVVNATLGDATTGTTTLTAGTNNTITFNAAYTLYAAKAATFTAGTGQVINLGPNTVNDGNLTITNNNVVEVGSGEVYGGVGSIIGSATNTLKMISGGSISPATNLTTGIATTKNLQLVTGGIFEVNLTKDTTPGTGSDQVSVVGAADITGSSLRILVPTTGLDLNATYTILANDAAENVVGQFVSGATVAAFNNPLYIFTISYNVGNNDVTAKLTSISTNTAIVDVQNNQVFYYSNAAIDNNLAVTRDASKFTFTESAVGADITLTQAAVTAGWQLTGTTIAKGNWAGITAVNLYLYDGLDTLNGVDAGAASVSVIGTTGTLTIPTSTSISTTGSFSLFEDTSLLLDGGISAGTGISITGANALILSGTGTLTTTAGNISAVRTGDFSLIGPTMSATGGTISIAGSAASKTSLKGFIAQTPTFTISGSGFVDITTAVPAIATGTLTISAVTSITDTAPAGRLEAVTLNMTAPAIGTLAEPIFTKATTIVATSTTGGAYLSELDGATVTATATSTGEVSILNDLNLLVLAGTMMPGTQSGSFTALSNDGLQLVGSIGATAYTGTISLTANADGAGSEGFLHSLGGTWRTSNASNSAGSVTVNTPAGGTGNAILGSSITGTAGAAGTTGVEGAGTLTVNANKGSILWNPEYGTVDGTGPGSLLLPDPVGGTHATASVMLANDFVMMVDPVDGGSIGTQNVPIQAATYNNADFNNSITASTVSLTAGSGGIYFTEWRDTDPVIVNATARTGDIQILAGNSGGGNVYVTGRVYTGAGNIWIAADDDLYLDQSGVVGGPAFMSDPAFAGTILLNANRDAGNEQRIIMGGLSSVETTNATSKAVVFSVASVDNNPVNNTIGGITAGNIKVGAGGTITLDAASASDKQGNIFQKFGSVIDARDGTIVLNAISITNGVLRAGGQGILFDLDGTSANQQALQIRAQNVVVTSVNSDVWLAESSKVLPVDDGFVPNGFNLTASVTGIGFIKAFTGSGQITVNGAVNNDGNNGTVSGYDVIQITANASDFNAPISNPTATGGIVIANTGTLADANSGNIILDAYNSATSNFDITFDSAFTTPVGKNATFISGNPVKLGPTTTITTGTSIIADTKGLSVATGRTLTGFGTANTGVAVDVFTTVDSGATLAPGSSPGTINTSNLVLAGTYALDVNGKTAGQFDQTVVTGSVNITGAKLDITVGGTLALGDKFIIIDNDGTLDTVTGSFVGGPDYTSVNNPLYVFSINTAGGDGNDVELEVTKVLNNLLHVTPAGVIQFATDAGINDVITVDISGGEYFVTDTATPITLTAAAKALGWLPLTPSNTVHGPVAGITGLSMSTSDGTDKIDKLVAGVPTTINSLGTLTFTGTGGASTIAGSLGITGPSTLAIQGDVAATGTVAVSGVADITATAAGKLGGSTITLTPTNAIGTSGNPLNTQGSVLIVTAGAGGVFVNEADGANVLATATGAGSVSVSNVTGTLTFDNPVTTTSGSISLVSGDDLVVNTTIGSSSFTGTINLAANTDGAGTNGYTQTLNGDLLTKNTTATAAKITVNTSGGGTGDAVLGVGSIGSTAGGTFTVQTHGGDSVWNSGYTIPASPDVLDNIINIVAHDFVYMASGAGGIGTQANPIQMRNFSSQDLVPGGSTTNLTAGSGGAYIWTWGGADITLTGATATGAGNIQVVGANNSALKQMWVTGNVTTGSGHIDLWCVDNIFLEPGVIVGGAGFSGTVLVAGNRDKVGSTGYGITMDATSSIVTTNTTSTAVAVLFYGDAGVPTQVTLSNITVGDGGTISVDVAPQAESGQILVQPGTTLNAGATGIVTLRAGLTTGVGDIIGTSVDPVSTTAGTVTFDGVRGSIWINESDGANVSGVHSVNAGAIRLNSATGALTVNNLLESNGAPITFNAPGGIVVSNTLGDTNTGALAINGPLSGAGTIALGSGDVTINQATPSNFGGNITGTKNIINLSTGTLTLSGTIDATGTVQGKNGTTVVTGTLTAPASVSTTATGTLAGTGIINSNVNTIGTLSPGTGALNAGTLTIGSMTYGTDGVFAVDVLGDLPANADSVTVNGAVNLSGSKLVITAPNALTALTKFTIINNTSGGGVTGIFQGYNEGDTITVGGQGFVISYVGGVGNNDVVLTVADAIPPLLDVTPGKVAAFLSKAGIDDSLSITNDGTEYFITDSATTISLTTAAKTAGWTGSGTNTVHGPMASVTSIALTTGDGNDTISNVASLVPLTVNSTGSLSFTGGSANITGSLNINGASTLAMAEQVIATGNVTVINVTNITATGAGKLGGGNVTLGVSNGIGTSTDPLNTQATDLSIGSGDGGVFIVEADGATVSATATNAGAVSIVNLSGSLSTVGPVSTGSGPITLSSDDALQIDSAIGSGAFTGVIALTANTDGAGSEGFTQTLNGSITTINTTASAASIKVNTNLGGTGDATLGVGIIGASAGGTLTVQSNDGSILWNNGFTLPALPYGAVSNTNVLRAHDYAFSTSSTGTGSIGTALFPIQTDNFATTDAFGGSSMNLTAGSNGIFLWDWGIIDLTLNSAVATGGDIQIATANATTHDLAVTGNVTTGNGKIELWSDDILQISATGSVGGAGFSGTVSLHGNRDGDATATTHPMVAGSSILTSNATASAVEFVAHGTAATVSTISLSNVTVGNGGTITIDASPETGAGRITVLTGTSLNAGATGNVNLSAGLATPTTTNADVIGTTALPVRTTAGSVLFQVDAGGNVNIVEFDGASVSGFSNSELPAATVTVTSTTGVLAVASTIQTNAASITLNSTDGVAVSGTLGDSNSGPIAINGPLSGPATGAISLGITGGLTLNQATASTYTGDIAGSPNVIKQGLGTLTLNGTVTMAGTFIVNAGTSEFSGTMSLPAGVESAATGTIAGSGVINAPVTTLGVLNPGSATPGNLTTGSVSFAPNSEVVIDLLGVGVGQADKLTVIGGVNLSGSKLTLNAPNPIAVGSKFTIIDNDDTVDAVSGFFDNLPATGDTIMASGQPFTISYVGGDNNDVVLTRAPDVTQTVTTIAVNQGYGAAYATQRSRVINVVVNFGSSFDASTFQASGKITLTRTTGAPIVLNTSNGLIVSPSTGTVSSLTLTFADVSAPGIDNASLSDGYWQLGGSGIVFPGSTPQDLFRLFGDIDGLGQVEGGIDFPAFGNEFNVSTVGLPGSPFDFDNNGQVDGTIDFTAFGNNFNVTL